MDYLEASGHRYEGDIVNGEPHGFGQLTLPDGTVYTGSFLSGEFHGEGELAFVGPDGRVTGRVIGKWDRGELVEHRVVFGDDLAFQEDGWGYLTAKDRRFHREVIDAVSQTPMRESK